MQRSRIFITSLPRVFVWSNYILLSLAFLLSLIRQDTVHIVISTSLLIISAILVQWNKFPIVFLFLFPTLAILLIAGSIFALFDIIGPYDKIVHIYASFTMTLLIGTLLQSFFHKHHIPWLFAYLFVVCIGVTLGVGWEIVEWILGNIFISVVNEGVNDTMLDIVVDSCGALIAAWIGISIQPRDEKAAT